MRRARGWVAIALFGATFAIHVTGCSLIGLTAGSIVDATQKGSRTLPPTRFASFYPGDNMTLTLEDGDRIEGVYRGAARVPDQDYASRYRPWRDDDVHATGFPRLGERVSVDHPGSINGGGEGWFRGFAHGGIELGEKGAVRVIPITGDGTLRDSRGKRIPLARVRERVEAGDVPLSTAMRIDTDSGVRVIPIDAVALVSAPSHPNAARTGFMIGLVADVAVVAVAASSQTHQQNYGGCTDPTIYPY